jgi:DNA-binding beta-propeller fold protein YncE
VKNILLAISLTLAATGPLHAGTFDRSPIAPELGVDALDRGVARDQLGKSLFSNPYATVTIGNVDVYDRFPYVEARTFDVVSDPAWNRLVYGEAGRTLRAYDGRGTALGALAGPRGMAVDEEDRVYVADTGNDRIVVLQGSTEFGEVRLTPLFAIGGLSQPYGVAYSDGGTAFSRGDDFLYVADTGKNRIVALALEPAGARVVATLGDLGSGVGRFAGPMAITAGRSEGANTRDVYVTDAHNRRIVHLWHEAGGFTWVSDAPQDADIVTSIETDQWGNLYVAAPNAGVVRKLGPDLSPVALIQGGLERPRGFHVPFVNVRDHREGTVTRVGRANGLTVEQWTDRSGMKLWSLGLEIANLAVVGGHAPSAQFVLTDRADVSVEIRDAATGRSIVRQPAGTLAAGSHTIAIDAAALANAGATDLLLRVTAASRYANGPSATALATFRGDGGAMLPPSRAIMLGNWPNPIQHSTRITFLLPAGAEGTSLQVFDAMGRQVRSFDRAFQPGLNEVVWDGTNERGRAVPAGVYFSRLQVSGRALTLRMVMVR